MSFQRTAAVLTVMMTFAVATRADEPKKVPFEMLKSQHMAVQVKVNGKGPFRLVFDTGAPMMLVNNKLAKEAGIIKKDAKPSPFALFGAAGQFKMKEFELGELKAKDVDCVVMDHPTVAAMAAMFGPIDGIVGFPFFAKYRMTIDYQAKQFTFEPVDFKPTNIMDSLMNLMMKSTSSDMNAPKILSPAGQWGFVADKGTQDSDAGLDVKQVLKDSPAAKGGLEAGDRLLTLDGRWTDTVVDLFEAASHIKPGKTVALEVLRNGKKVELKVTPAKGL